MSDLGFILRLAGIDYLQLNDVYIPNQFGIQRREWFFWSEGIGNAVPDKELKKDG
jgi:hypothetical protein